MLIFQNTQTHRQPLPFEIVEKTQDYPCNNFSLHLNNFLFYFILSPLVSELLVNTPQY